MKRENYLLIGIIFGTFFFTISCKEKDCHETGECPPEYYRKRIDPLKPYLWAKKGSWWVYKHNKTGELDTHFVTSFYYDSAKIKGSMPYSKQVTIEYDILKRSIFSTYDDRYFYESTHTPDPDATGGENNQKYVFERASGFGIIYPIYYYFSTDFYTGDGTTESHYIGFDSSINIQGETYFEIIRFEVKPDVTFYPYMYTGPVKYPQVVYYWAKGVGIVSRFNGSENFSWELIKYNIIN